MSSRHWVVGSCVMALMIGVGVEPAAAAGLNGPTQHQSQQGQVVAPSLGDLGRKSSKQAEVEVKEDTDRIIVKFKEGVAPAAREQILEKAEDTTALDKVQKVKETAGDAEVISSEQTLQPEEQKRVVDELESQQEVEFAEPDLIVENAVSGNPGLWPNDSLFSRQWNLRNIDVPQAWREATGTGVTIGIADTGNNPSHPDMRGNYVPGYDFVTGYYDRDGTPGRDSDPSDPGVLNASVNWHGTHVEGIAAANAGNGIGVAGVAPDARISHARVLGRAGSGYVSDMAAGLSWLAGERIAGAPVNRNPSEVINFSVSWPGQCPATIKRAIDGAHARGIPVVIAAGNDGANAANRAPANCLGAVVVGASTSWNQLTGYSNWGWPLDVVAPGGTVGSDIWSTYNTGFNSPAAHSYGPLNGTSMAAPHVAGVIALMKQKNPKLSVEKIRSILVSTADSISGYRKVNAQRALEKTPGPPGPRYRVRNGIGAFYHRTGGAAKYGVPTSHEIHGLINGGVFQTFSNHYYIYWSPFTGSHSLKRTGAISAKFVRDGSERRYGYPSSEEVLTNSGRSAYQFFQKKNGRRTLFLWSTATGAHIVTEQTGIGAKWARLGREHKVGFPRHYETRNREGGVYQQFFNIRNHRYNTIFWTPRTGAHMIWENSGIGDHWKRLGREYGAGYPVAEEHRSSTGVPVQGFRTMRGDRTRIFWVNGRAIDLRTTTGIGSAYFRAGGERTLGHPVTREYRSGGKVVQRFSKGKKITWTPQRGARIQR